MKRMAVFGLGRFGSSVATTLQKEGVDVLAVDRNRHLAERLKDNVSIAVSFDATDRDNLTRFDVGRMDAVVVGIGDNFESSVKITLLCKELGVPYVICKATNTDQRKVLQKVGADEVIQPETQMGHWVAESLLRHTVVNFVELPDGYALARIQPPQSWYGRSLAELQLLTRERLNLIQVHRPGKDPNQDTKVPLPAGNFRLEQGDLMDVIGANKVLARYREAPAPAAEA
ncbi:MAG: TrkA family potassium uptake protein [Candidatus Latescibacteria bacterium]|nr:TrkA family potassium uptake protein [Candidatus Latescibacterota bacterium]